MRKSVGIGPSEGQQRERSVEELVTQFGAQMRATARRFSANADDADDAYQRTAEILLHTRPNGNDNQVARWLRTTVRREALAVRARRAPVTDEGEVPEEADIGGSAEERAERLARLRLGAEALGRLKPQEIRCLLLRAEGFSYKQICAETGFSYTKVNRCVTEGRRAFLARVDQIESGAECERLAPQLSALADGEAASGDLILLRPHLAGCPKCKATLREFRQVPAKVAALVPAVPVVAEGGGLRGALESFAGVVQDRVAMLGERGHQLAELATGQKLAAAGASAAILAGGGAATVEVVDRAAEPPATAEQPQRAAETSTGATPVEAPPAPATTPAPAPEPAPTPEPEPQPAPAPENEFTPEAAPPAPAPAPPEFGPSRGAGGGGGGEFAP